MAQESTENKKSPMKWFYIFSMAMMVMLVGIVFVLINPQANKFVKDINLSFSGGKEEHYTKPIEFMTEMHADDPINHYIEGGIVVSTLKKKEMEALNKEAVKLNDLYIRYLATISIEEAGSLDGQEAIKNELKKMIEKETGYKIEGIYFTKWIFQ